MNTAARELVTLIRRLRQRSLAVLICSWHGHHWIDWPWGETICERCNLHTVTDEWIPWEKCDGIDHTFYDSEGKEL